MYPNVELKPNCPAVGAAGLVAVVQVGNINPLVPSSVNAIVFDPYSSALMLKLLDPVAMLLHLSNPDVPEVVELTNVKSPSSIVPTCEYGPANELTAIL